MTKPNPNSLGRTWRSGITTPNDVTTIDGVSLLALTDSGGRLVGWAKIDAVDLPLVSGQRWCLRGAPRPYVLSRESRGDARLAGRLRRSVYLHRLIMGNPDDLQIDHINGDAMDNRRQNLRVVTAAQNLQNQVRSDHRNVYRDLRTINGGWFVGITVNRKRMRSKCLPTREAAMMEAVRMRAELMTHVNESRHTIRPDGAAE